MSTDLKYLAFTALLTASLWIPYVRTLIFTLGYVAIVGIFVELIK